MQIAQCTATGEQHGLMGVLPNSVPFDDFKSMKPADAEKMRKQKKDDEKLVWARYINRNGINERLEKPYCKYAGEPIQLWKLIPEQKYQLPMGFIKEVNSDDAKMPVRAGLQSVDGVSINSSGTPLAQDESIRIHELVPLTF